MAVALVLVWSGIEPHDRFTWWLEVAPVLIGVPILIYLYPRFRFTRLVYTLVWVHAVILMVGGHYTYARHEDSARVYGLCSHTAIGKVLGSDVSPRDQRA